MHSEADKQIVVDYMTRLTQALSSNLRKYRGYFGPEWQGIDSADWSMILYFCTDGIHGRIVPKWLERWVKVSSKRELGEVSTTRFDANVYRGETCYFSFRVAKSQSAGKVEMGGSLAGASGARRCEAEIRLLDGKEAAKLVIPQVFIGRADIDKERLREAITRQRYVDVGLRLAPIPWSFAFYSHGSGESALMGFDEDPFIEAHGIADHIISAAGIEVSAVQEYRWAIDELLKAVDRVHRENEDAIHEVIRKYPFILVDKYDYRDFESKPRIDYTETMGGGEVETRRIEPDFMYEQYDERSLIVEIEAASKHVLKNTQETAYQLPTAENIAACFQIANYKRIIDGPAFKAIREKFEHPDRWRYEYLLVVGSERQAKFDRRSWNNLRDGLEGTGIEMRTWDHYIKRLERIENAGRYVEHE